MSTYEGKMPPHGIIGAEKHGVTVQTFEPTPPHGWIAQILFKEGEKLIIGHELFYAEEMKLLSDLITLYGFERL